MRLYKAVTKRATIRVTGRDTIKATKRATIRFYRRYSGWVSLIICETGVPSGFRLETSRVQSVRLIGFRGLGFRV